MPSAATSRASFARFSTESWKTPGIEETSLRIPFPAAAKSG